MTSWELDDVGLTAKEHPYTYYKASEETIDRVAVGEYVKLVFCILNPGPDGPGAERMWVIVEAIGPGDRYVGSLANAPRAIRDLAPGAKIEFQRRHIVNTQHDPEDHLVDRLMIRCQVTKVILDGEAPIGYIFRDKPLGEDDSGWRISAGRETREYMKGNGNVVFVSLGAVMNRDDSILNLLSEPVGSEYMRDPATNQFRKVR